MIPKHIAMQRSFVNAKTDRCTFSICGAKSCWVRSSEYTTMEELKFTLCNMSWPAG